MLTKCLLDEAGLPVPSGYVVASADDAISVLGDLGGPVVVKPLSGHQGERSRSS